MQGKCTPSGDPSTCSSSESTGAEPQAVVLACSDCDMPLPEAFGTAANDIAMLRSGHAYISIELACLSW